MTEYPSKIAWSTLALAGATCSLIGLCLWEGKIQLFGSFTDIQRLTTASSTLLPRPTGDYPWAHSSAFIQRWAVFGPVKESIASIELHPSAFSKSFLLEILQPVKHFIRERRFAGLQLSTHALQISEIGRSAGLKEEVYTWSA